MARRGRSQPIKPIYGRPPMYTLPLPPAPVGKVQLYAPAKDDRQRGARCRQGVVWRGMPPFTLPDPPPPLAPKPFLAGPSRAHLRRHGKPLDPHYGWPPFVYPTARGYVDVTDALVYGLTITDSLVYGLTITDSRLSGITPMAYDIGDVVKLESNTFTNEAGTATDPTTVTLEIEFPNGSEIALTYAAGDLTRVSAGRFRYDLDVTMSGRHTYNFRGTGAIKAAEEAQFVVKQTNF